ncbi:unnamed protein product [Owenia fusiformis]|uniref:Uncharacterized protein n=1 Tax=Owenia fusiformis TaxID=6347 RepID=A0A8J1XFR8_OWEFU|nr:unnamed protein product [Owenia fusiformis]
MQMSSRDPYPFPTLQNDEDFQGASGTEKKPYGLPTHLAQKNEPWQRLNTTPTLSSARREVYHFDPQAPRDSLDFVLKAQYDHHNAFLVGKPGTLNQPETLGQEHGRVLKNRIVEQPEPENPLNHPLRVATDPKRRTIDSMHSCHNAIEGHHTQTTNRGYSRKPGGGFFEY